MSVALRFLAIGALLFAVRLLVEGAAPAAPDETLGLEGAATAAPHLIRRGGSRALQADDLLTAAALDLNLAAADPVVARRLRRNDAFLGDDAAALGLADSDLVVRRRLATRLRLAIEAAARADEPDEAALAAFLAAHPQRFALPPRVRLQHVFLSRARRGDALTADAGRVAARLTAGEAVAGDPLPLPAALPLMRAAELEGLLGTAVAAAAFATPPGVWSAPVPSPYGLHLLRVAERRAAETPPLAAVRAAVREALLAARADAALAAALVELRATGGGR